MTYPAHGDLEAVNIEINALPYTPDIDQFNQPDYWTSIERTGTDDCEGYAIAKLDRLLALGWPLEKLRLACCYTETPPPNYHAVLIVSAERGDYMLDNRFPLPVPVGDLERIGYTPDRVQNEGGSREWRAWT